MDITNDSKLCACGCGESLPANWKPPARDPNRKPPRFIAGHNCRVMRTRRPPPPPPNPGGLCMCGCGQPTPRAAQTSRGNVAGEFIRYLQGHNSAWPSRRNPHGPDDPSGPNPSGKCLCGCGGAVAIADRTDPTKGTRFGCYVRFLRGHDKWKKRPTDISDRSGICACGCGEKTPIATRSARGNVKGLPMKYVDHCHAQRLIYEVQIDTGCWLMNSNRPDGYVRVHRDTRLLLGHVAVFEEYREKIPEGMTLDHLCRTRNCVNPAHMEVVTLAENNRRRAQEETDLFTIDDISYTIDEVTGCWNATRVQRDGYARVFVGGNVVAAHRIMYVRHRGNFAKWQQLDHLCRNKACLNPAHLEPVSRIENVRRAINAKTKFNVA